MAEKSARPRLSASLRSARPILRTAGRARIASAPIKTCSCAMVVPPDRPGVATRARRLKSSVTLCRDLGLLQRRQEKSVRRKVQGGAAAQIWAALRKQLIEADAGVLDDLDPFVVFRRHEQLEPVRRELDHVTAILLEARLELRQRLRNLLLQAGDRGRRGLGRSEQSDPGIDLEIGDAGLGHGW